MSIHPIYTAWRWSTPAHKTPLLSKCTFRYLVTKGKLSMYKIKHGLQLSLDLSLAFEDHAVSHLAYGRYPIPLLPSHFNSTAG